MNHRSIWFGVGSLVVSAIWATYAHMTGGIEWKALLRPSRSRTYPSPAAGNAPFMIVLLALLGIFAVVRGVVG